MAGIYAVKHPNHDNHNTYVEGALASGYGSTIRVGDPINVEAGVVTLSAGDSFDCICNGIEYTDADGKRHLSQAFSGGSVATDTIVHQSDANGTSLLLATFTGPVTKAVQGKRFDFVANTLNASGQGASKAELMTTPSTGKGAVEVFGLYLEPGNDWTSAKPKVLVFNAKNMA